LGELSVAVHVMSYTYYDHHNPPHHRTTTTENCVHTPHTLLTAHSSHACCIKMYI